MAYLPKTEINITKVHSTGRVVIPSEVRQQLGIVDGDKVLWFWSDQVLCLEKVKRDKPKSRYIVER